MSDAACPFTPGMRARHGPPPVLPLHLCHRRSCGSTCTHMLVDWIDRTFHHEEKS